MTDPVNSPDPKKFDMGKMARGSEEQSSSSSSDYEIIDPKAPKEGGAESKLPIRPAPNILDTSDNAWLEGTRGLQKNLIRQLQQAKASWSEGKLIGSMRQQVIREVTEKYVMFLREEAKMTSEIALQARKTYLEKELLTIKSGITKELADMTGKSIREIEMIFQDNVSQIQTEELQKAYAQYIFLKIFDLMGMAPPK